ncbi:LysR substrate-binding domain-containing protein [uncultured Clostridium sp.]|uniref:LysR substrate-binding domain-containing protein n=1 Tax=uncultured Clostridium sp. TaxID=59620 RepID=UPI0025FA72D2|nr:LysR substrate-binding domain-containing protein [uncultured Clostridium sp.]
MYTSQFLSYFIKKYPDIDIETAINNTSSICKELKDIRLDVGLVEGTCSSASFEQEYFFKDEMVLALPYNNDIDTKTFSLNQLKNRTWIAREEGSGIREFLNMFLDINELTPQNIIILGSNYAVKEAVRNNLGITIISKLVAMPAAKNKESSIIDLDRNYVRHFSYLLPKHITTSKATKIFLEELKNYSKM